MKKLFFIRHSKDQEGFRGGWSKNGLTDEGVQLAKTFAQDFSKKNPSISLLISSDLPRSLETAIIIGKALSIEVQSAIEWREINNGEIAGLPNTLVEEKYPGLYFRSLDMQQCYPSGESPQQFYDRICSAFDGLLKRFESLPESSQVLVVTHGGVISIIKHIILEKEWNNKIPLTGISNLHCLELNFIKNKWIPIEGCL